MCAGKRPRAAAQRCKAGFVIIDKNFYAENEFLPPAFAFAVQEC
jgi:hypothetical protein